MISGEKEIIIDGSKMTSRKKAHSYLKKKLSFPDYYGNNLDALYDVLSERMTNEHIKLINTDKVFSYLSEYGFAIVKVFRDASISSSWSFETDEDDWKTVN